MREFVKALSLLSDQDAYALPARPIRRLYQSLMKTKPKLICETGSGISTMLFTKYCQENGSAVVSLENDATYYNRTLELLSGAGLPSDGLMLVNYDPERGYKVSGDWKIDFMLIDGPKESTHGRRSTLTSLSPFMSEGAVVWIDDYDRTSNRNNYKNWSKQYPIEVVKVVKYKQIHPKSKKVRRKQIARCHWGTE